MLQCCTFCKLHSLIASASFRNNPLPLHGASTITMSNRFLRAVKSAGSLFVTMVFDAPHLIIFSDSTFTRFLMTSLLTKTDCLFNNDCIWVDLPPGAAQRSSTTNDSFRSQVC